MVCGGLRGEDSGMKVLWTMSWIEKVVVREGDRVTAWYVWEWDITGVVVEVYRKLLVVLVGDLWWK
jgi:hypothetical protein